MLLYNYRAIDKDGKILKGSINAQDFNDAKSRLQSKGLMVIKLTIQKAGRFDIQETLKGLTAKKLNLKHTAELCKQLHIITSSGINILDGLKLLKRQSGNKTVRKVMDKIYNEVQKGQSLSQAMSHMDVVIPSLLLNMLEVGEVSGNLEEILSRMANYYEKESFIKEKFRGAMMYPLVLLTFGVAMIIFFMNFVLPEITNVINESGGELPLITEIFIGIFGFLNNYYSIILGLIVGVILILKLTLPGNAIRFARDTVLMHIPMVGRSVKNVVTSRFTRSLSITLKGGIPLLQALQSVYSVVGNAIVENIIKKAVHGITTGEHLGENMEKSSFFDPIVSHLITIGEETGELEKVLDNMADYYEKEAETSIIKMTAAVEPFFTIIIGGIIALIIVSMMAPIFNMLPSLSL